MTASYVPEACLAAPVFGRGPVAETGNLNILAADDAAFIDRARPLFDVIGTRTWRLGGHPLATPMLHRLLTT